MMSITSPEPRIHLRIPKNTDPKRLPTRANTKSRSHNPQTPRQTTSTLGFGGAPGLDRMRLRLLQSIIEETSRSGGMADAHGSGPCTRKGVGVQLPPSAPYTLRFAPWKEPCDQV